MKILNRTSCILSYAVNLDFFDRVRKISNSGKSGHSYWEPTEHGSHRLTHTLTFDAGDDESGEWFIQYRAVMICDVVIEDVREDALQMLAFEQEFNESMANFIKENSLSHISELHIPPFMINEWNIKKMEDSMRRAIATDYDEKRAEVLKQMKGNLGFTPTIKTRVTINKTSG
ncbi:hypothetical protein SAMN05192574_11443 [Mucilaginibacter gossypiicola]|uniref:Uncharacterized protein n=1 Tax=Mucilaginibacter gossypiicola TaxID=551995 RepID=A0A1H8SZR6_9SPHI|nr:hypothetical protein [Mucilaginibacter gossypiicola]SEO84270.1 hypothetical protein SAMN05192574_11443 [Mucilaginibacter gossypiicola]